MMTHSSIEERRPEGTQQNQAIQNSFVVGSNGELRPTTGGSVRVLARPFWFLFSLSFVGLLVFLAVMTVALNRSSIQSSEHVFNSLIDNRIEQLKPLARGYAYWDEAVERLVEDFDRSWAVNNIGIYLLQQGIDAAYVVNNDDQIVVSVVNGEVIQPAPGWSFTPEIWALIRDARATEDDAPPVPIAGKVRHSAGYAIAAAARMTTYTESVDVSTDHILLLFDRIDQDYLTALDTGFLMHDLRFSASPESGWRAEQPLILYDGSQSGYFIWRPELAGFKWLPMLLGGICAAFVTMVLAALWFIRGNARVAAELGQARTDAEEANRAKSAFVAGMSHELRSPLNSSIGFSEMIQNRQLPSGSASYKEYAGYINEAGLHLLGIINNVLDLSKIEASAIVLREEVFDVGATITSTIKMFEDQFASSSITPVVEFDNNLPNLHADLLMFRQTLINLLSNAVKFTPNGGIVTVKASVQDSEGFVIQVLDTGIGIAKEDIPIALTPFRQVDGTLSRSHSGTGLGLPLSKSFVEAHGGSLDLQSAVGVGTTVTVRFPAERIVDQRGGVND